MQVIRIEHRRDKHGIFNPTNKYNRYEMGLDGTEDACERHTKFMAPYRDKSVIDSTKTLDLTKDGKEWFCAFKSIEQLQQWLTLKEINILLNNYFNVYILSVDEFQEGEFQVIYTKESIKSKKVINSLFKQVVENK